MCNAYTITSNRQGILDAARAMGLPLWPDEWPDPGPRYRVSPRTRAPIVRLNDGRPAWSMALWHFVPPAPAEPPKYRLTNARADKLAKGWPWRMVSAAQRCLILADGFYEPEKPAREKGTVPWRYYSMADRTPFVFAGLWCEIADQSTGEVIDGYTIVTTDANPVIHIHERMPAILDPAAYERWLTPGDVPTDLLGPYPAERMQGWRVGPAARSSRSPDVPALIEPVDQPTLL